MKERRALMGSLIFLVLVPCVVAGLVPWWLTGWRTGVSSIPLRILGVGLVGIGSFALLHAFGRFVFEGLGTPAPVAPTEHLVVGGLYRYVRNPMYLAVAGIIIGQALIIGRVVLVAYAAMFLVVVASFVRWYEEPTLLRNFGTDYEAYRRAVPAWWPRIPRASLGDPEPDKPVV